MFFDLFDLTYQNNGSKDFLKSIFTPQKYFFQYKLSGEEFDLRSNLKKSSYQAKSIEVTDVNHI